MFMRKIDAFVTVLLVLGGLTWGLMGFFNFDLIAVVFGGMPYVSRIIYGVVGICALYELIQWRAIAKRWGCTLPGFTHSAA